MQSASVIAQAAAVCDLTPISSVLDVADQTEAQILVSDASTWILLTLEEKSQTDDYLNFVSLICARRSLDGVNWSEPSLLFYSSDFASSLDNTAPLDFQLATNQQGRWLAAWSSGYGYLRKLFLSASGDDGQTWSAAKEILTADPSIEDFKCFILWDGHQFVLAWTRVLVQPGNVFSDGTRYANGVMHSYVSTSYDGSVWSEPRQVSAVDEPVCEAEITVGLASSGLGQLVIAILCVNTVESSQPDEYPTSTSELVVKTSSDGGLTWTTRNDIQPDHPLPAPAAHVAQPARPDDGLGAGA
jgi:hypothetical protein